MRTGSGKVLTPRDIEELAREAEAGYDLSKARPRQVGRPSLGRGTSPRIQFRIESDVFEDARKRAESESRSLSEVGRQLFSDYARRVPRRASERRSGA